MFSNFAPHLRVLVFVPICAAIVLFIVCPDSARASYTATQKHNGATYNAWRQLYTPYRQHRPASTGLLSTETGLHTGTDDETKTRGNYRGTPSIIDQQSKPLQVTQVVCLRQGCCHRSRAWHHRWLSPLLPDGRCVHSLLMMLCISALSYLTVMRLI
ncbi:uncharacterized protein LOC113018739 isoform X2 [Astatotilapia calliptera]|uniref:uncharacterized protein LOC113018739 isoform X2 n=1 Tax=Astatotilapia calliptera TaxID=8154 RepID=UPI000E410A22|nr:uncharacterized protein LOC113018739 isoform X2 [Astatotilapia calliptera]